MSSKDVLVNEIVKEINEIPVIYLKTLYAVIHSFKETIPDPVEQKNEIEFDWDELLEEIHNNRKRNNLLLRKSAENYI